MYATGQHGQHDVCGWQHSTAWHATAQQSPSKLEVRQHSTARHNTHSKARHDTHSTWHGTAPNTEQHSTAKHSMAQCGSARHSMAQHSMTPSQRRAADLHAGFHDLAVWTNGPHAHHALLPPTDDTGAVWGAADGSHCPLVCVMDGVQQFAALRPKDTNLAIAPPTDDALPVLHHHPGDKLRHCSESKLRQQNWHAMNAVDSCVTLDSMYTSTPTSFLTVMYCEVWQHWGSRVRLQLKVKGSRGREGVKAGKQGWAQTWATTCCSREKQLLVSVQNSVRTSSNCVAAEARHLSAWLWREKPCKLNRKVCVHLNVLVLSGPMFCFATFGRVMACTCR